MPTNYLAQTKSPGLISYFYGKTIVLRGGLRLGQAGRRATATATVAPSTHAACHTVAAEADADGDARQTKD